MTFQFLGDNGIFKLLIAIIPLCICLLALSNRIIFLRLLPKNLKYFENKHRPFTQDFFKCVFSRKCIITIEISC